MSPDPIEHRDAGLRRVNRYTKGAMAGGLALTGALSVLAARSFAGTTATTTTTTTATTAPTTAATAPTTRAPTNTTTPALQSPSYRIRSSPSSGRVTSGGS